MNSEQDISASSTERSSSVGAIVRESASAPLRRPGAAVIVNADDWGCTAEITDRILECILHGVVSSTSAMVFMADSERAAALARTHNVDAGLHLNLTTAFSGPNVPPELIRRQQKLTRFLRSNRYAPVLFHPLLASSFEYVALPGDAGPGGGLSAFYDGLFLRPGANGTGAAEQDSGDGAARDGGD